MSADTAARLNAIVAVEHDEVRRHERIGELRLAAAVALAREYVHAEALLAGVAVPASWLDGDLARELHLDGDVTLTGELALEVCARLPRSTS